MAEKTPNNKVELKIIICFYETCTFLRKHSDVVSRQLVRPIKSRPLPPSGSYSSSLKATFVTVEIFWWGIDGLLSRDSLFYFEVRT